MRWVMSQRVPLKWLEWNLSLILWEVEIDRNSFYNERLFGFTRSGRLSPQELMKKSIFYHFCNLHYWWCIILFLHCCMCVFFSIFWILYIYIYIYNIIIYLFSLNYFPLLWIFVFPLLNLYNCFFFPLLWIFFFFFFFLYLEASLSHTHILTSCFWWFIN